MKTTFRLFLLFVLILFVGRHYACSDDPQSHEPWESRYPVQSSNARMDEGHWVGIETRDGVMGTRFSVEIHAPGDREGRAALRASWRRIYDLETTFSTWIPQSIVSHVNRHAAAGPVKVNEDVLRVLAVSREIHGLSAGAFDPTVGPLLAVWKPLAKLRRMPAENAVRRARDLVGLRNVITDERAETVAFRSDGMALDFGAVAKGFAAEAAARTALIEGASTCRVNAGGDMFGIGSTSGFEVTIRDPDGGPAETLPDLTFRVRDAGVATSGNYGRYTEIAGRRYSHILDPRTGRPVEDAILQVTVIASTGARADALATALTVLGVEQGIALANRLEDVEALYLVRREGKIVRIPSRGFPGIGR